LIHRPYLESMVDHALSINNNSDNHSSIEQDPADTLTNLLFELSTIATNTFGGFFKCSVPAATFGRTNGVPPLKSMSTHTIR